LEVEVARLKIQHAAQTKAAWVAAEDLAAQKAIEDEESARIAAVHEKGARATIAFATKAAVVKAESQRSGGSSTSSFATGTSTTNGSIASMLEVAKNSNTTVTSFLHMVQKHGPVVEPANIKGNIGKLKGLEIAAKAAKASKAKAMATAPIGVKEKLERAHEN
jgi:hypothetical protein